MKTKRIILLAAMSSLMAVIAQAEVKTVVVDNQSKKASIEIKEGYVGKCLFASLYKPGSHSDYSNRSSYIRVIKDSITVSLFATQFLHNKSENEKFYLPVIAGPATVELIHETGNSIMSMEITPNETATSKAAGPALVLPEGEDGKQKLVLESSTDLVNWTEDSLGSKDLSDKKRFYRLRAVKE
jgi:hypothetical protein